ncbi:aldo/keto reductase [Frateuria aurantia]
MKMMELAGRSDVVAVGQGTWRMGERASERQREVRALREGIALGLNLIDTAEMYGEGGSEEVVGEAIAGQRDQIVLVSKVYPHHAGRDSLPQACERSLRRLGTDHLDLYLLHWPGSYPLEETVEAFERLREAGKIRHWGVSNFDTDAMSALAGSHCACNQVLYNLEQRGIEFDLLPWCQQQAMPVMAYCPVGQGMGLLHHPGLLGVAARYDVSPAQIALAWLLAQGVMAIPKAVGARHILENSAAASLELAPEDLQSLDLWFPPPSRKQPLAIV